MADKIRNPVFLAISTITPSKMPRAASFFVSSLELVVLSEISPREHQYQVTLRRHVDYRPEEKAHEKKKKPAEPWCVIFLLTQAAGRTQRGISRTHCCLSQIPAVEQLPRIT